MFGVRIVDQGDIAGMHVRMAKIDALPCPAPSFMQTSWLILESCAVCTLGNQRHGNQQVSWLGVHR
jgi:hypothetical protein